MSFQQESWEQQLQLVSCLVPSYALGLYGASPWKWTLLQGIFPTQGSNPGLLHCRQILYQVSTQLLLCFHLPSPPSSSSPGRKGLTLRSTSTPHAGAGLGDTPALLPEETPSGASPASTPRRCWNDCSQRVAPSSTHSPGSAPVGKAGRPSGKAGSSRALRAVQSRHSLGVCCY